MSRSYMPGNWHFWANHRKGEHRFHAIRSTGDDQKYSERFCARLEIANHKGVSTGFRIHFGNKSSGTPFKFSIGFYWIAFYFGLNFKGLGRFCEWLGRGHKRNISLTFHDGSAWWELWYDDDGGHDDHHKCESWRRPKLYPWRWGRRKHRPWMCFRQGSLDLNPLDAIWGHRYYRYTPLERKTKTLKMKQFAGDTYEVELTLQENHRERRHGPKWIRHRTFEGYSVQWDCETGIPVQNHDWKGDCCIYGSAEKIDNLNLWWVMARVRLYKRIEADRIKNHYRPPAPKLIDIPQKQALVGVYFAGETIVEFPKESGEGELNGKA